MDRITPKQAKERGNGPRVPARVYAIDKQRALEPSKVMEGKNFEDEISLRGRECEDPKIILKIFPCFLKTNFYSF